MLKYSVGRSWLDAGRLNGIDPSFVVLGSPISHVEPLSEWLKFYILPFTAFHVKKEKSFCLFFFCFHAPTPSLYFKKLKRICLMLIDTVSRARCLATRPFRGRPNVWNY